MAVSNLELSASSPRLRGQKPGQPESPMSVISLTGSGNLPMSVPSGQGNSPVFQAGRGDPMGTAPARPLVGTAKPLHVPPNIEEPLSLGAQFGCDPVGIHCGTCGYLGPTYVRYNTGRAHTLWTVLTCGFGVFCPVALDADHYCAECHRQVAAVRRI